MRRRKVVPHELGSVSDSSVVESLPKLDLFPKIEREYNVQTTEGGALSIITYVFMLVLFFSEFVQYSRLRVTEHLQVDKEAEGRLRINLNITFPKLTCADVNLVAMDVAGEHQLGISHTVHKHRLDKDGNTIGEKFASKLATKHDVEGHDTVKPLPKDYCGSCYGAGKKLENGKDSCCNDCDSVKAAYATKGWDVSGVVTTAEQCAREAKNPSMSSRQGEGCNVEGHLQVNKVAGNIHIALGKSRSVNGRLIHQFSPNQLNHFDTSHTVNTLSFGEPFPGQTNPLDTVSKSINIHKSKTGVYQYYIKVIPTLYTKYNGVVLSSNQYSYTDKFVPVGEGVPEEEETKKEHQPHRGHGHRHASIIRALPGVFFIYDMSPFQVRRTEESTSIFHFLVRLCAVLGGVFAVSRMIDRVWGGAREFVVGKPRRRSSGSGMLFG
eukprot:g7112.t1